jgi:hypothetical protein
MPAPVSGASNRQPANAGNQSGQAQTSQVTCFKCGQASHYANECTQGGAQSLTAIAETDYHHIDEDNHHSGHQEHPDEIEEDPHQSKRNDGDNDIETQLDGS